MENNKMSNLMRFVLNSDELAEQLEKEFKKNPNAEKELRDAVNNLYKTIMDIRDNSIG